MNKNKANLLTTLFMAMFLSILFIISTQHPEAWKIYGIVFGVIGVASFTTLLRCWIYGGGRR